ncbi:GNAT family N-acetyltransferase [Roseibium sp.]|uniref:GNAT family N-acetyltransferase n=1 Tax=Roseibium sp. TaxID=1936156 RepID=UPI003263694E
MPLKLRPATIADAPALTDILRSAKTTRGFAEDQMAECRNSRNITEATIRSLHVTVAEQDGKPVAFSGLSQQGADTLRIDFLVVAPETRRLGIGNLLLTRAEDDARNRGLPRLFLETGPQADPFYETRGFRTIATRRSELSPDTDISLMEKRLSQGVHKVRALDIGVSSTPWAFEMDNEQEILSHFEDAKKRIALLWNGRTLKLTGFRFEDGVFSGSCCESSFAAHLAWRDWGAPDTSAFNLFGSAILRSGDGALLYGVMSAHTATGGLIYPPGGNLDLADLTPDGKVDAVGAIYRELEEETGLTGKDVRPRELLIAFDGPRISIAQLFDIDGKAENLRERILRFSEASEEQELADIRIIRHRKDLEDPSMVPFARAIGDYLLPHPNFPR